MIMNNEAWNKVTQTHDIFKKIIAPLKQHLGINFGYMIVFNDGRYYQIIEDLECLKAWVTNVETSHIFCARNVTTYFDKPYNFTIWPEEPTCAAMEIYKEYGIWNGVTVSKTSKDYTELYWFTRQNAQDGWHKWFIRNKSLLHEIIKYLENHKNTLHTLQNGLNKELFKFNYGFDFNLSESKYIQNDSTDIAGAISFLNVEQTSAGNIAPKRNLSTREAEVLELICTGYSYKSIALKLSISVKTVNYHFDSIKTKLCSHSRVDLIKFYNNYCH